MNIQAGLVNNMLSLNQSDIVAYDTPDGVVYHIGCMIDAVSFATNSCRFLRLEISSPPTSTTNNLRGLEGLANRLNSMRNGVSDSIGKTILVKYIPVDQVLSKAEYSSLSEGKPISYKYYSLEDRAKMEAIDIRANLSSIARKSLVAGVDPSLLFGSVPLFSKPKILSNAAFLNSASGSLVPTPSQQRPIIVSTAAVPQFSTFKASYALSNFIVVHFDVKQSEILEEFTSKTLRFEVSALNSESSPISFSQKIQLTLPGEGNFLDDPNVANSSADTLSRRIVSFDTPDLVTYGITSTFVNEPYVMRKVGYVTSDSTVVISSPPEISSRIVMNPEKIISSQLASTSFPFYISNSDQQDTWKIVFERLPAGVETIRISLRRPSQPACLKFLHQTIRTQGEKSFNISTGGLASGQDYIVNVEFEDSRVGKLEASNEILWTYKKKSGWASLSSINTTRVTVFDDITRNFVTQVNIKASVIDDNSSWSDFNNSLSQSGVNLGTGAATNRFAKVFRAQSIDLFTGEQQFISEGLSLNSFLGAGVNLRLPNVNPHVIIIEVGIIDNEGVYFAGSTSQSSLSTAESYNFFRRSSTIDGNFGISFSKYYTGVSFATTDNSPVNYSIRNLIVDQTRAPDYDVIQWDIDPSNANSPIDHFQIAVTIDGTSYLLGCVPFRPSSLKYRYIERNLSGILGRVVYTINPVLTNMQSSMPSNFIKSTETGLVNLSRAAILSQGAIDENYELSVKPYIAFERVINAIQ